MGSHAYTPILYIQNLAVINSTSHGATDHIRLLRPSKTRQDPEDWEMRVFSLNKAPNFAALSYSWGRRAADAHLRIVTEIASARFAISKDLFHGMTRLKSTNSLEWLWIDAICIHQQNNDEKSNQVAMMQSIYKTAKKVYIWLGEAAWADNVVSRSSEAGITNPKLKEWLEQGANVWWRRLWPIQEVVSCKSVYVCIGPHCTSWDRFWSLLLKHLDRELSILERTPGYSHPYTDAVSAAVNQVTDIISLRRDLRGNPKGESIYKLIRRTSPCGASKPLDRVYSLLGVATDTDRANISINYDKSATEVFAEVVEYQISTQSSLDVLFEGWYRGTDGEENDPRYHLNIRRYLTTSSRSPQHGAKINWLPTWMPNFLEPLVMPVTAWKELHKYRAALHTPPDVKFHAGSLHMRALHFDVIDEVIGHYTRMDVMLSRAQNAQSPQTKAALPNTDDPRDALVAHKECRPTSDLLHPSVSTRFAWDCFSTKRGFMGLSLQPVSCGDEVIVPFGSSTPVILDAHKDDTGQPVYVLVSDCYVDGIMDGELMELHLQSKIESQIYHIR